MQKLANKLAGWLKEQLTRTGAKGFVVGLSGGIDSSVTVALCRRACPDGTLGLIMPCYSNPNDQKDAELVSATLGVPAEVVVLDDVFELMVQKVTGRPYQNVRDIPVANIKARLRMITLYYYAARRQFLVAGTNNRSEIVMGYFTKYGDGGVDLLPIANLLKLQVRELARVLGIPEGIITKAPSAGLWAEQDDEKEMGVTYDELDCCILNGEGCDRVKQVVMDFSSKSVHKMQLPLMPPF
ncbi:MAG: NAD(+) synthase [Peptococcaceae bacterium]|nr:NAD(+) synthase [Peptococcaceae bacterium]